MKIQNLNKKTHYKKYPQKGNIIPILDHTTDPESTNPGKDPGGKFTEDIELLDAYSRAVVEVVKSNNLAVVSIFTGEKGLKNGSTPEGSGSGFVIAPDGYLLTNYHVIAKARSVSVVFADGNKTMGTLIGSDLQTDIALIKVESNEKLSYVTFGDSSSINVGQLCIAMGNPYGFHSTVSTGVISALDRSLRNLENRLIENIIQHTAPLNPGNSGGPLLDSRGKVIGINTAIISMAQGLGFAIAANTAKWVISELLTKGKVKRAYLGIYGHNRMLPRKFVYSHKLDQEQAVQIVSIQEKSPAQRGGLRMGDLILSINGKAIQNMDDIFRISSQWQEGQSWQLEIIRNTTRLSLNIQPVEFSG